MDINNIEPIMKLLKIISERSGAAAAQGKAMIITGVFTPLNGEPQPFVTGFSAGQDEDLEKLLDIFNKNNYELAAHVREAIKQAKAQKKDQAKPTKITGSEKKKDGSIIINLE